MTPKQFFQRIVILRQLQKEYFKTRASDTLRKAKAVEREIDDEIARVNRAVSDNQSSSTLPVDNPSLPGLQSDSPCLSSGDSNPDNAVLNLVNAVLQNKREKNIVPGYAIAQEVHALLSQILARLVNDGRLIYLEASVNRLPAYDLPDTSSTSLKL